MHTSHWRKGFAAILAAGLLATGASAQDGASGDVTIKDKTPVVSQSSDPTADDSARLIKPTIVDRDPFTNQLIENRLATPSSPQADRRNTVSPGNDNREPKARPGADPIDYTVAVEQPAIPAPEVTVTGIVSGSQAIISTNYGTRVVTPGQKLGDYRVSAIGQNYVSFSYGQGQVFKVPMDSEF
ncbi:MAG: hypothetical protein WC314_21600 [Vulcanimicrobiota bacterium]